jgi:hypothetical protein
VDDAALMKILAGPSGPGETPDEAHARKERILGSLFGRLSAVESRGMWLRISRERTGDPLSEAFARCPTAMRDRLMSMLVDERRLKMVAAR